MMLWFQSPRTQTYLSSSFALILARFQKLQKQVERSIIVIVYCVVFVSSVFGLKGQHRPVKMLPLNFISQPCAVSMEPTMIQSLKRCLVSNSLQVYVDSSRRNQLLLLRRHGTMVSTVTFHQVLVLFLSLLPL